MTFVFEAIKITVFCLAVTLIYWLLGVSQSTLLVMFNVAVMACAATFSPGKKSLWLVAEGTIIILLSIMLGGIIGFYLPVIAPLFCIIYAVLAFSLPITKTQTIIFVTGAVMFLIFSFLPFNIHQGLVNGLYGLLIIPLILIFYVIFDRGFYSKSEIASSNKAVLRKTSAAIAGLSLLAAWGLAVWLHHATQLSHLYWIGLTALVVIQGSQGKTIKTSLVRIAVNTCGAVIVVLLMTYIMPSNFWINFALLVVFLFGIFALGFSYIGRTLFIELFVLSFTHLLGQYHNIIAYDRVILTLIGGVLVIMATLLVYQFKNISII